MNGCGESLNFEKTTPFLSLRLTMMSASPIKVKIQLKRLFSDFFKSFQFLLVDHQL
jgi:hypothetical protein